MNNAFGRIYAARTKGFDFPAMQREFESCGLFLERPVVGGIAGFDEEGAYYPTTVGAIKRKLNAEIKVNFEWWTHSQDSASCIIEPLGRLRLEYYSIEALDWAGKMPVLKALMKRFARLCMEGLGIMLAIDLRKYPADVDWDRVARGYDKLTWDDELPDVFVVRNSDPSCVTFEVPFRHFFTGYSLITRQAQPETPLKNIIDQFGERL